MICALLLFAVGCGNDAATAVDNPIRPVKSSAVFMRGGDLSRSFNGTSKSGAETRLSFRSNGLITSLKVKVGDRVKRGQLLGKLDQRDMVLNYQKAQSAQESARIQLETARSNLERVKELYQANSASLSDYEQAKNNFANAQNNYQSAQKSVDLQASQLSYGKLTAPTDGIVTQVNSEINEFVQAGSPVVVINAREGDIEINVGVPESYISRIQEGEGVTVTFPSIPEANYSGIITEVGFSSSGAASYPVIVKLTDTDPQIRPDMPAEVNFLFKAQQDVPAQLVVDFKAVGEDEQGNFGYKLVPDGEDRYQAKKTRLEIGPLTNDGFIVLSGLEEGDLVATAGLRSLYDGQVVSTLEN
ncbi:MAG: efflux RND transporter periplasmic adaptor subunit [Bacteroidota bacterium]